MQSFNSVPEMEKFLLEYGEQVIDVLGVEVDRIETEIKVSLLFFKSIFIRILFRNNPQKSDMWT